MTTFSSTMEMVYFCSILFINNFSCMSYAHDWHYVRSCFIHLVKLIPLNFMFCLFNAPCFPYPCPFFLLPIGYYLLPISSLCIPKWPMSCLFMLHISFVKAFIRDTTFQKNKSLILSDKNHLIFNNFCSVGSKIAKQQMCISPCQGFYEATKSTSRDQLI